MFPELLQRKSHKIRSVKNKISEDLCARQRAFNLDQELHLAANNNLIKDEETKHSDEIINPYNYTKNHLKSLAVKRSNINQLIDYDHI